MQYEVISGLALVEAERGADGTTVLLPSMLAVETVPAPLAKWCAGDDGAGSGQLPLSQLLPWLFSVSDECLDTVRPSVSWPGLAFL